MVYHEFFNIESESGLISNASPETVNGLERPSVQINKFGSCRNFDSKKRECTRVGNV